MLPFSLNHLVFDMFSIQPLLAAYQTVSRQQYTCKYGRLQSIWLYVNTHWWYLCNRV